MKPANRRGDSRTATLAGPAWLREDGGAVLLFLRVQPCARRTAVCGEHGRRLKIAVNAPPLDGRANEAVAAWLADKLGLPKRQVKLEAGAHSRDKTVRATGIGAADVLARLAHP